MEVWRKKFRTRHSFDNILASDRQIAEGFIERFKQANPTLMELKPEIGINQFLFDVEGNPCNFFILLVGHKFIFDYRLIPDSFENIKVNSNLCENIPKEFPYAYPWTLIEEYHSPNRYIIFVKRNLEKIRKSLKSIHMSVDEALDALTGDFNQHKNWALQLKNERVMKNKKHIDFFNKLLMKTGIVYSDSDVYKNHKKEDWGYSVTATSFKKNEKVVVGFNWGVDGSLIEKGKTHGSQKEYPIKDFPSLYDELGSLKRTLPYFYEYFEDNIPKVQINYCFFRSENENQITEEDLNLSSKLFDELINYLEPSMLISFSRSLNNYLEKKGRLINKETTTFESGNKSVFVTKGKIEICNREILYFNLPHPNSPITGDSRNKAWNYCFDDLRE